MSTEIYDEQYCQRFAERADTPLGRAIYAARWDLVHRHAPGPLTLLDYGCATGAFHRSSPNGYKTHGYDVNPHCGFSELPAQPWDVVTMWDVIEHVPDPAGLLRQLRPAWLFISTPNLEVVRGDVRNWRHYRPREHIYYFDRHSLGVILPACGYEIVEMNFDEGRLRDPLCPEAILSLAAKRKP